MSRVAAILTSAVALSAGLLGSAQQPASTGSYKVLKTAKVGGEGAWDYIYAVDPKSGYGFTSSRPVSMFDAKTMTLMKTIDVGTAVKENSPTSFEVEQNLQTMNGARTVTFDSQTQHLLTMSVERGPAPSPPPDGGRGAQGTPVPGSFTILVIGK